MILLPPVPTQRASSDSKCTVTDSDEGNEDVVTRDARDSDHEHNLSAKFQCCDSLLSTCLQFIDKNATDILGKKTFYRIYQRLNHFVPASEGWCEADIGVVRLVLCRSSLHIKSELEVSLALASWTKRTCARYQLETSADNIRCVASGCQYLVRWADGDS